MSQGEFTIVAAVVRTEHAEDQPNALAAISECFLRLDGEPASAVAARFRQAGRIFAESLRNAAGEDAGDD